MKELKDYLHLYLGCDVIIDYEGKEIIEKLQFFDVKTLKVSTETYVDYSFNVKLILRPLSDMTDEEMNYCVTKGQLVYRGESPKDFVVGWGAFSPEITRYLLSKSFDLFDLIPSGLAIDSTTLKTAKP